METLTINDFFDMHRKKVRQALGIPKHILQPTEREKALIGARNAARKAVGKYMRRHKQPEERMFVINDPNYGQYVVAPAHIRTILQGLYPLPFNPVARVLGIQIVEDKWGVTKGD